MQFLTTSPGRERDSCLPLRAMDFPRVYVLKHLVKNMKTNEMCQKKSARHAGETHCNNSLPFGAHGFTCTGMTIFWVTNENVSFTLGKVTSVGHTGRHHA